MPKAKHQRVFGVETERLFDLDFVVVEITHQRFAVDVVNAISATLCGCCTFSSGKALALSSSASNFSGLTGAFANASRVWRRWRFQVERKHRNVAFV